MYSLNKDCLQKHSDTKCHIHLKLHWELFYLLISFQLISLHNVLYYYTFDSCIQTFVSESYKTMSEKHYCLFHYYVSDYFLILRRLKDVWKLYLYFYFNVSLFVPIVSCKYTSSKWVSTILNEKVTVVYRETYLKLKINCWNSF